MEMERCQNENQLVSGSDFVSFNETDLLVVIAVALPQQLSL